VDGDRADPEQPRLAGAEAPPSVLALGREPGLQVHGHVPDIEALLDACRVSLAPLRYGAGIENVEAFNHLAKQAITWTASELTPGNRAWLAALPAGPVSINGFVEICHGSPVDEDIYIFDEMDARQALMRSQRPLCLFGHTHVPAVYKFDTDFHPVGPPRGETFRLLLDDAAKYLVNCGAVGQPRDGDARAAFGMLDTASRTLTVIRTPYDVTTAQAKIIAAGLPEVLAQRLGIGR
jgi:diadenosine tetraphosphatase ApaH/serine/threonine PP2A family protein phosphatase